MAGVDVLATAFSGANAAFIAEMYAKWVESPRSVDPSFTELFEALGDEQRSVLTDASGASWAPRPPAFEEPDREAPGAESAPIVLERRAFDRGRAAVLDWIRALMLIRIYRVRGHLEANLDPLGLQKPRPHPELDPRNYGFGEGDMDRPIFIDNVLGRESATMREIVRVLRETYCGTIGVEFMHIQDPEQKSWIQRRFEDTAWRHDFSAAGRERILRRLTEAEAFETFCQRRYVGTKRFGLEGGESRSRRCTRSSARLPKAASTRW